MATAETPSTVTSVATTSPESTCPSCQEPLTADAVFCEACGTRLNPTPTPAPTKAKPSPPKRGCSACGPGSTVDTDGYCTTCGKLVARERDHVELDVSVTGDGGISAAAVTDRGVRHHRNEDAVWIAATAPGEDGAARVVDVVVADGVSSSFDPDVASAVAVETAGAVLADGTGSDVADLVSQAIVAAGDAVATLVDGGDPRRLASNPSCTIVTATVRDGVVTYGWVGDSRAYWIADTGPAVPLTVDDSWATEAIREGVDPQQAWNDNRAHTITRWLGADADPVEPQTGVFHPDGPGVLLVCSDGLWNYLTDPQRLADTVRAHTEAASSDPSPMLTLARTLTQFAVDSGGADNITVATVRLGG
jgi:serine/threonine protein phosphatase PrpC